MKRAAITPWILIPACLATVAARAAADVLFLALPGRIIRLEDLNADGDFLDFSETAVYADGLPAGLGRIAALAGRLFVAAAPGAEVLVIEDVNADGDALDSGEVLSYGQLPASAPPALIAGLAAMPDGALFAADATSGALFVLRDLNADGDALDFGETTLVAEGLAAPTAVAARPDGRLLVAQNAPAVPVRILDDRNADGDFLDFAENLSYAESLEPGEDLVAISQTRAFFTRPAAGEVIALVDLTGDDDALDFAEVVLYASALDTPRVLTGDGGGLFVAAGDAAGTLLLVRDVNGDGDALDFGEVVPVAEGLNTPSGIARVAAAGCLKGDVNLDTFVDFADVGPFVDILIGAIIPPDPCPADLNEDGRADGADIQPFVDILVTAP